jgi:gamma-glutamylcyclotransferase (GGCT)/AIG2-like uncharacterized protein YtfP
MDVFAYGTLTDPEQVAAVLDDPTAVDGSDSGEDTWRFVGDATLDGLQRVEGRYPTLAPGSSTRGRVLRVDEGRDSDLDRRTLDAYEGVDRGLYVRVGVPRSLDGERGEADSVAVYVGDPVRLGVEPEVEWPGSGDLESRVQSYVEDHAVRIVVD